MYHFVFPENLEKYDNKETIAEIRDIMMEDLNKYKNLKYVFRKIVQAESNKLRYCIKCSQCSAKLWLQFEEGVFRLKKTLTKHFHVQISQKVYKRDEESAFRIEHICRYNSLYMSEEMNLNYFLFHRCLYITFCELAQIRIVYFSGVNNQQLINIFGVGLYETLTEERFISLVKEFFEGKKSFPDTIIFNRHSFMKVVKEFIPAEVHLIYYPDSIFNRYDKNCIIEQLVKLKTDVQFKNLKNSILFSAREQVDPLCYKEVFQQFEQYTLYKMPKTWIGINLHSSLPELLYHETEEAILLVGLNRIGVLLKNIPSTIQGGSIRDEVKSYCLTGKSSYLKENAFIHLAEEIEIPALNWIVTQYGKSFALELEHTMHNQKLQFRIGKCFDKKQRVWQEKQHWSCSCSLKQKTGLPCCHLIKCCVVMKSDIRKQIDEFWFKDYVKKNKQKFNKLNERVTVQQTYKQVQKMSIEDQQISQWAE